MLYNIVHNYAGVWFCFWQCDDQYVTSVILAETGHTLVVHSAALKLTTNAVESLAQFYVWHGGYNKGMVNYENDLCIPTWQSLGQLTVIPLWLIN